MGNFAIAVAKFIAAGLTGSSSMLTEGVHSLVATGNQWLLLYGIKRSQREPDVVHPFGYGRELYFWSFVVALLIFAGGAGISIFEGILHVRSPEAITNPAVNYVVLVSALVFEGGSLAVAARQFGRTKGDQNWWKAIRRSKDPSLFAVLFEDSAAILGILIAGIFITLSLLTGNARLDGVGSILIGLELAVVAGLLARESKGLLIGERASPELSTAITALARAQSGVCAVNEVLTLHMPPDQIVAAISLSFDDDLNTARIERAIAQIEERTTATYPEVTQVFVRVQAHMTAPSPS